MTFFHKFFTGKAAGKAAAFEARQAQIAAIKAKGPRVAA